MKSLDEVQSYLLTLKQNLTEKENLIDSLEGTLKMQLETLESLESNLREALANLADSEQSRVKTEKLLTQASGELKESEQSFKDYQRSEILRLLGAWAVGVLVGFGIGLIF